MNERIKELAFKAYNNAGQGTPEALSSFMEVYSEKFAELIVRECADCSYHMGKDSGPITADLIKIRIMSLSNRS